MTVTLDKSGRVLIPKALRDRLGIAPGAELSVTVSAEGDGAPTLVLKAEEEDGGLREIDGMLVHVGRLPDGFDTVEFIRQQREERAWKLGGLDGPPPVKVHLDTSVLIPGIEAGNVHHRLARGYFDRARSGEISLSISAHTLAEAFATLTVLPLTPRIRPSDVEQIFRKSVLPYVEVVALDGADYAAVLARMADLRLVSGAIYDALHVRAAEKAHANELVTFNGRDFRRMPPEPPVRLVVL